jgi:hypothetical protein
MTSNQFPKISARNLEGRDVTVPDDLTGSANLVILAFEREHQQPAETWLPHFAALEEEYPGLEVWQIAALARRYRFWRGAIDGAMRAGIPDARGRLRTLTAFVDLLDLQRTLDLIDLSDIPLYLLGAAGTIRWEATGGYNRQTLDSLKAAAGDLLRRS